MIVKKELDLNEYEPEDRQFIRDMLSYISEHILDIYIEKENVILEYEGIFEDEIKEKLKNIELLMNKDIGFNGSNMPEIKTLSDYTYRIPQNKDNIYNQMLDVGMIKEVGIGSYVYSGVFLQVFEYFIMKIKEFWRENFKDLLQEEMDVPVLMKIEDYEKGRYFESFPHYIMLQTNIINDIATLSAFTNKKIQSSDIGKYTKEPKQILRHAACAPVYSFYENQVVEQPQTCLVSGKCFRNEEKNIFELSRLNEFYMMEYVFIGDDINIDADIKKAKNLWQHWIDTFELNCKIDTANDSFFADNYRKLKLFQLLGEAKQELKIYLPDENQYIACGSTNYHRTHFTKPYNIRNKNGYCQSACFAFGLERLTFALLSQKGLDIDCWDNNTREEIEKYVTLSYWKRKK